jgi:4,5-DOPA dioxygenase extradiol
MPEYALTLLHGQVGEVSRDLLSLDDLIAGDEEWGLDHGTWSVLYPMFPKADIPVGQLSINRAKTPPFHYEIGGMPASLRKEGIPIRACLCVA